MYFSSSSNARVVAVHFVIHLVGMKTSINYAGLAFSCSVLVLREAYPLGDGCFDSFLRANWRFLRFIFRPSPLHPLSCAVSNANIIFRNNNDLIQQWIFSARCSIRIITYVRNATIDRREAINSDDVLIFIMTYLSFRVHPSLRVVS